MPRELTRDETYEAFDCEIALRLRCIEVLEQTEPENLKMEDEIQRCLIRDKIWLTLQIEPEEYNLAIAHYQLEDDEYVSIKTKEVEDRLSEDLRARLIEPLFQNP